MTLRNFSSSAAQTTLSAGVTVASTTLTVAATTGFPPAPFILAVNAGASAQELVLVTAVAGTNLTVTRGYDSTVASAHDAGAVIQHSHAALDFREANTHVNATSGVHGLAGAAVGTTDTQALTNKDLTSGTNSFPSSLATTAGVQTLTNKTLALGGNTVSGTKAEFNAALMDGDFATLAGAEDLTNKTLTAPAINGAIGGTTFGPWTAWTPTITAESGTFTTASGTGRYVAIGKLVIWSVSITITTVGSAVGGVRFTLPLAAQAAGSYIGGGRENASTGVQLAVHAFSTTVGHAARYDNASVIAAGRTLMCSGVYEAA